MKINIKLAIKQRKRSFLSLKDAIAAWFRYRDLRYSFVSEKDWMKYKTSDTIFIFCSGPSINDITQEQLDIIKKHDSMGLNFAFLSKIPMTYYYLGYEPTSMVSMRNAFSEDIRSVYKESLWFELDRCLYRFVHPRLTPELFPPEPKIAIIDSFKTINITNQRSFTAGDFKETLIYRGVVGFGLQMAAILGYKKIVLLGVDLNTYHHFFDDYEVMIKERKDLYGRMVKSENASFDEFLPPKQNKTKSMEEYYYAVDELFFKPKGIELYVGNQGNLLSPRIKVYPDFFNNRDCCVDQAVKL